MNEQVFQYIYSRIFEANLDNSGRFYMVVMPYSWSFDGSVFSFLLGHGVKSYSIIGSHYSFLSGEPIHDTSNNIYTDVFWESGLLGLILLLMFFLFVFSCIFKRKIGKQSSFIAFYFLFELMLSGMFRADYASARFFIILYLIYLMFNQPFKIRMNNESRSSSP
jgi:O-antigen ligase